MWFVAGQLAGQAQFVRLAADLEVLVAKRDQPGKRAAEAYSEPFTVVVDSAGGATVVGRAAEEAHRAAFGGAPASLVLPEHPPRRVPLWKGDVLGSMPAAAGPAPPGSYTVDRVLVFSGKGRVAETCYLKGRD